MAKKFDFRLQSVLNLRSHKVEQAKDSLHQVQSIRNQKQNTINENLTIRSELFNQKTVSFKASEAQHRIHHINHLEDEIKQLESDKIRLIEIENLRRGHLTKAMKDEKVLVKLKEKKMDDFKYNINREETQELDEIALKRKNSFEDQHD
jgi:flagellar FliJ protein